MPDAARIPGGTQVGLQLHAGVVHFREDAPWLDELMAEAAWISGRRSIRFHKRSPFITWRESHRSSIEELWI